jgi:hypothetical protein
MVIGGYDICSDCHGTGTVSDTNAERAEFIRAQVELARKGHLSDGTPCPCQICSELRDRESLLRAAHGREWQRVPWVEAGVVVEDAFDAVDVDTDAKATPHWHRGFIGRADVPALSWVCERVEATCRLCRGAGWGECPESGLDADCPQCHGTGTDSARTVWRVTPWALAVAAAHPVTEWWIGGLEPFLFGAGGPVSWHRTTYPNAMGDLQPAIWDLLKGETVHNHFDGIKLYDSREAALLALAQAAGAWVRDAVVKMWAKEVRT